MSGLFLLSDLAFDAPFNYQLDFSLFDLNISFDLSLFLSALGFITCIYEFLKNRPYHPQTTYRLNRLIEVNSTNINFMFISKIYYD